MAAKNKYPMFPALCESVGLPKPVAEYRFHPTRLWRMDFAWPEYKVYLEIDGGLFSNGGHNRGAQILKDHEKQNAASVLGWRPLKTTPWLLMKTETLLMIRQAIYGINDQAAIDKAFVRTTTVG